MINFKRSKNYNSALQKTVDNAVVIGSDSQTHSSRANRNNGGRKRGPRVTTAFQGTNLQILNGDTHLQSSRLKLHEARSLLKLPWFGPVLSSGTASCISRAPALHVQGHVVRDLLY